MLRNLAIIAHLYQQYNTHLLSEFGSHATYHNRWYRDRLERVISIYTSERENKFKLNKEAHDDHYIYEDLREKFDYVGNIDLLNVFVNYQANYFETKISTKE